MQTKSKQKGSNRCNELEYFWKQVLALQCSSPVKAEKNYSDETKHRQSPTQTHHTKSEITSLSSSRRKGSGHHCVHRLHTGHSSWKQHQSTAMSWQVLLHIWILSPWLSCHRNLPSTSQANSPLPTELHSWIIIINFWYSVINVLKLCLHSKLSDTTNKVLPETSLG